MLHHCRESDGHDSHDARDEKARVEIAAGENREYCVLIADRDADPGSCRYLAEIDQSCHCRAEIGADDTEQDRNDLDHSLTPDIADYNDNDRDQGYPPAGLNIIDRRRSKVKSDRDNDGTCNYRREVLHYLAGAIRFEERGENKVKQACACDAEAGIRQKFTGRAVCSKGSDSCITAKECE